MSSAPTDRIEYTSSWRTREGCFAFPSRLRTAELSTANADLLASNRELEAFSYSVSHDPRAPLRSISGFSQIVLEDYGQEIDETGKTYLRRIVISQRMAQRIDDLLNLARITRQELVRTTVDMSALAHAATKELAQTHPERQVEVVIAPGIHAEADPVLMGVVLANLFDNEWKFTQKTAGARIEFRVDDQGIGVGLATVQRIIARHGGRVWAEAAEGSGAAFFFTLPGA